MRCKYLLPASTRKAMWAVAFALGAAGFAVQLAAAPADPVSTLAPAPGCDHHEPGLHAVLCDARLDAIATGWDEILQGPRPGALGGPLLDQDWRVYADFHDGRVGFRQPFAESQGLGPHFNATSCAGCHATPNLGGRGRDVESEGIRVHGPAEVGREAMSLRKQAAVGFQLEPAEGPVSKLKSPPLYGYGLLDSVPRAVHLGNVDAADADGNGIRGMVNVRAGHASRFGQKANEIDLLRFVAGALRVEMGLTSPLDRNQAPDADALPDPEVPASLVRRIDAFVRHLAPPPRGPVGPQELEGERLFGELGCVGCHRPQLGTVQGAYTDLLLHDLGRRLDNGLIDGLAQGRHWRTPPLWGFRFRERYLHDERAASVHEVQRLHGGEAAQVSARFLALPAAKQAQVVAFLRSL